MEKQQQKTDEKKQAAASYIITYYNQVILLNDTYSKYINLLVELEAKYGATFEKDAVDQEKNSLLEMTRTIRYVSTNAYIQLKIIKENVTKETSKEEIKKIEGQYLLIRDKLVPKRADVEDYVIEHNRFLVSGIIQELLTNSSEFLDKIY